MKRPWPGGLSELIKGAHVKVKRISLEKVHNDGSQPMNVDSLASKENNMDVASKDCTSENISIPDLPNDGKESFSKKSDSIFKNTTEFFCNTECKVNSDTFLTEKVATILSETTAVTNKRLISEEASQCVLKPLDCTGEVKKKKAEPVPLPLLALFLQQLKSKTKPTRPKPNSEACSLSLQSDKASHETEVAENLSFSAASFTPSSNTQLVTHSAVSPKSPTIASSILTCTVARTGHETVLTPNYSTDAIAAPTANLVHDTLPLSAPNEVTVTTSESLDKIKPDTTISDVTPDTKIVSVTLDNASSDHVASCEPEAFPVTTPDVPDSELINDNATTDESTTEPSHDSHTVPCSKPVPEVVPRAQSPGVETPSSPFCAISSPYVSAPSSPDPFPPSMFSDRPIPPRKTLELFPPCLLVDGPRPLLELSVPLTQRDFTSLTPTQPDGPAPVISGVTSEVNCPVVSPDPCIAKKLKQSLKTNKGTTYKGRKKKGGKTKLSEDPEVMDGSIPVPMQPNLEDVEGQLFVSFMSKKALEIHLGDEVKETLLQKTTEDTKGDVRDEKESIDSLEKVLLRDLKNMKNRQVIHPVLQAVGLKLNLLDVALSIDLQYLGVCLPIPPPVLFPEGCSETCSSQVQFVSRTGKTTDITKIKGWREKFSATSPSSVPGVTTSSDTGQKNLSAFCSDMLDEYLESEGKLIDERAASFSQAVVTPVAYQLPTKSTSYVRTLDSVLKKQAPPLAPVLSKPSAKSRKTALTSKIKEAVSGVKPKKSIKSDTKDTVSSTDSKSGGISLKKNSKKSSMLKPMSSVPADAPSLSQSKTSKMKSKKGSKFSQGTLQREEKHAKDGGSVAPEGHNASSKPGPNLPVGRSPVLPKTLVKLRDVEDGAVWEGKHRTYITMERAAIALSCFVTAEGTIGGSPSTVIKRRAPPCLNDFCRLGCVCASLVQERRQHHCGKPHCMLGCDCLRRKVVLLKNEETNEVSSPLDQAEGKVKKKKNRLSYVLSGPDAAPEPALHVKTLWDQRNDLDSEQLYMPALAWPVLSQLASPDWQKDSENCLHTSTKQAALKTVDGEGLSTVKRQESLDCARVRSFCGRKQSSCRKNLRKESHPEPGSQESLQEMEEGELRPPTQSGPTKRLEIVSKCKWETEGIRNVVLRKVCERMAQDRLKHPFWISKYKIQPASKTIKETDEGTLITYKVVISQPHLEENEKKKVERLKQLEAQLIETIGKSEVKGLPLLSQVTPAGLLKAEIKPPGGLGQIMVNGKPYPQARLELGQMGALHPANRLAAYITGRVCVANKHDAKNVTTATKTCTAITSPTSIATTTVMTSTSSSTVTLEKPTADKHVIGTEFVQFEVSCANSQWQKTASMSTSPMQNTVKNLMVPSTSVLTGSTGISVSPNMLPVASITSHASLASGASDGSIQVVKALPVSGSATPDKNFVLSTTGSNLALPPGSIKLLQPLTSVRPTVPGQRMVMFKAPNNAGQYIQLVPLSQFRAANHNMVLRPQQSTFVRLPTPNPVPLSKPKTTTVITSPIALSSATKARNMAPQQSSTTDTVMTSSATSVATKPESLLSGSKTVLLCHKPSTVKIIPTFLGNSATNPLRIIPTRTVEEPQIVKEHRNTPSSSSPQSSSEVHPANQGIQLTSQSRLTPKNQDTPTLDSPIHTSPTPAEESCKEDTWCSKSSRENVVFADHSYTIEMKNWTPRPIDASKDCSDYVNGSTYQMLRKEVLDLDFVEEVKVGSIRGAVLGTENGDKAKAGSQLMEEETDSVCSELTEDSDMYNDMDSSETSEKENSCVITDSKREDKNRNKQNSVDADMQNWSEKDDELVDIETLEEGAEKCTSTHKQMQHDSFQYWSSDEENEIVIKLKKRKEEMKRRIHLGKCFHSLKQTLNIDYPKVSKITLLAKALTEINSLTKQRDDLVKMQDKLTKERAHYIELASKLSGKNKDSICKELDEIIAQQKSLVIGHNANDSSLHLEKVAIEPLQWSVKKQGGEMGTNDNAKPLNINTPKNLASQDQGTKRLNTDEKMTAAQPSQPSKPSNSHPAPQLTHLPPIPMSREKKWPNILSRSRSQSLAKDQVLVPEIIPVVEAAMPWNQVITISNPLQPIDLTLGERQSVTPGVAAVSISIPSISYRLCEENPLPVLPPSAFNKAGSSVNTPVDKISLPKISSVVSLVESEKLLVSPPVAAVVPIQATCDTSAEKSIQNLSSDEAPLVEEKKLVENLLPQVVSKKSEHNDKIEIDKNLKKQKEDEKNTSQPEQDDDRLMSLLDELVFLNQSSEPQGASPNFTEAEDVLTELFTDKAVDMDDERSLSPLFLKLDEDIISSPTSKDEEIDDIPPKVDDLVKVIFGSESPPNSSESEIVPAASDLCTRVSAGHVKPDAPTPPPLLQMKTGGGNTADSSKEQASLSWRPMPKLAPLGLKTQETGHTKSISPHAPKSDFKLPGLHNAYL